MVDNTSIFRCALMILRDECPPNNKAYLCMLDENIGEIRCNECWEQYLFAIVNGKDGSLVSR